VVIFFARLPVLGKVKTRLAAGVGAAAALHFYDCCASSALQEAARWKANGQGGESCLALSDAADLGGVATWLSRIGVGSTVTTWAQPGGADLGARLHASFSHAFARGAQRVVVCGSDVPDLDAEVLRTAFQLLRSTDAVLGAAHDGGFYLLGLRSAPAPSLFEDVPWSTSQACACVRTRALAAQLTVCADSLPMLRDVDTRADLAAWRAEPSSSRSSRLVAAADAALAASPP
jgi:uncharacterized protein